MTQPPPRPGPPRPGRRPGGACPRPRRRRLVDATLGLGGHTEAVLDRCPQARVVGIDRDPPPSSWPASGSRRSATGSPRVHAVYDEIPEVLERARASTRSTGSSSTSASPRCSSTCASAASPTPRTRRWTCGWTTTTGRTAADVLNTYPAAELARILREYGEEKFAAQDRRARSSASARREPFTTLGPAGRAAVRRDPGAGAAYRRAPGQAHLPGAADRGQRRARRAAPGDPGRHRRDRVSAAAWWSSPTTRSRTGWSSRRSPPRTRSDVPADLPFVPAGHEPALRLVTRGAEKADAGRDRRRTRAPPRSGCAPSNASDTPTRGASLQMSSPAPASCAPASRASPEAAVERARLTVVPRRREPRRRGCRSWRWSAWCCCGGVVGLLLFNTSMQQASFAADRARGAGRPRSPPAQQTLQMELDELRDPQRVAERAQQMGMVPPGEPGVPRPRDGKVLGSPHAGHRGRRRCGSSRRPPAKPAILDPPADDREGADPRDHGTGTTTGDTGRASARGARLGQVETTSRPARPGDRALHDRRTLCAPPGRARDEQAVAGPAAARQPARLADAPAPRSASWSSRSCCRSSGPGWSSSRASTRRRTPRWRPPRALVDGRAARPSAATSSTATACRSPTSVDGLMVVADPT